MASYILVVDDEPDVARGWARALRIAGHEAQYADDSKHALDLCKQHPFDLVIIDYMMSKMTGIELLNEIRKFIPFIRSIIISGKLDANINEDVFLSEIKANIEADLYLHKPVENARLKNSVDELLKLKPEQEVNWQAVAKNKLEAATSKRNVRAVEKK